MKDKDTYLITKFFDFALSNEELLLFQKKILEDVDFREKFETFETAYNLINKDFADRTKQYRTKQWEVILNSQKKNKISKKSSWKLLSAIAVAVVLFLVIWQFETTNQKPNLDTIIANSWDKKIGLDFNVTRSNTKDSLKIKIVEALKAYDQKKYKSTINLLSNYKQNAMYYEDVLLLRGLSFYKIDKIDNALKTLDTLANYQTGKKSNVAKWYQGLIYLEQGKTEAAKRFLIIPKSPEKELKLIE